MLVKLNTFSLLGIDAVPVEVEVDCADIGLPKTILVGLPEAAVVEGLRVFPVSSLTQAVAFLNGDITVEPVPSLNVQAFEQLATYDVDFSDAGGNRATGVAYNQQKMCYTRATRRC